MVNEHPSPITGHKLSTVVPANMTVNNLHELTGLDLAMKLHYLRTVYYYKPSEITESLTIVDLKEPMFLMLDVYPQAAGRIRRHEDGRPHVKCNDSGVRIIEAKCEKTMEEWLQMEEVNRYKHLVYDKVLGPELFFSPPVLVQFTWFKCGGLAIGMSWAHVVGDPVSAFNSISLWSHFLVSNQPPPKHIQQPNSKITSANNGKPLSVKHVEPVGDFWLTSTKNHMVTFSFQINESKLKHLQSKISPHIQPFEAISALVWQSLARIKAEKDTNLVTVIKNDHSEERKCSVGNKQRISTVATDSSVAKLELSEVAMMIKDKGKDETSAIEEMVERESGKSDFIIYGANLTFVDMEGVGLYGVELKGQKPAVVDYTVDGIGDGGIVLVLQGPDGARDGDSAGKGGRVVTVILPEHEISELREELECKWNIA